MKNFLISLSIMFLVSCSVTHHNHYTNDDDAYSTHPSKDKRLLAIAKGYNDAKAQSPNNSSKSKEDQIKSYLESLDIERNIIGSSYVYEAKVYELMNKYKDYKLDNRL